MLKPNEREPERGDALLACCCGRELASGKWEQMNNWTIHAGVSHRVESEANTSSSSELVIAASLHEGLWNYCIESTMPPSPSDMKLLTSIDPDALSQP